MTYRRKESFFILPTRWLLLKWQSTRGRRWEYRPLVFQIFREWACWEYLGPENKSHQHCSRRVVSLVIGPLTFLKMALFLASFWSGSAPPLGPKRFFLSSFLKVDGGTQRRLADALEALTDTGKPPWVGQRRWTAFEMLWQDEVFWKHSFGIADQDQANRTLGSVSGSLTRLAWGKRSDALELLLVLKTTPPWFAMLAVVVAEDKDTSQTKSRAKQREPKDNEEDMRHSYEQEGPGSKLG